MVSYLKQMEQNFPDQPSSFCTHNPCGQVCCNNNILLQAWHLQEQYYFCCYWMEEHVAVADAAGDVDVDVIVVVDEVDP